jgi:hypothetical protein
MGAIFNTQGTLAIIDILSTTFTQNFAATATNAGLIHDLDPATGMSSFGFCGKYRLVATGPGAGTINSHFARWLNHFDVNGGNAVRTAMVGALHDTAKYEAIEFFVCPDANFSLTATDYLNSDGMYSLIVTARTPTYDLLP